MANVVTTAETNLIKAEQLKRAREIDFIKRFNGNGVAKLLEALGTTRKVPRVEGTVLYTYAMTGSLTSGNVPEGEIIPLTQISQTKTPVGELTIDKYRKATTAEAINKSGFNTAVNETDKKLVNLVQRDIRSNFFTFLGNINNTTTVTGTGLQAVLAGAWGKLQVLFEDETIQPVHFIHPEDIADYLKTATITLQTAFGMSYIENFLGLGRVILSSQVEKGTVYSTAQDNLILYYLNMGGEVARAFGLTSDETGYVGINSGIVNTERAQIESLVMSGIKLLVEYEAGVVVGTINP